MRPIGIGLAIGLLLAALAPSAVQAADISKDSRAKGMAAAPELVSGAGLDCQVADARIIGEAVDPKTKVKSSLYEVACTGSEGFLIQKAGDQPPQAFTCEEAGAPRPDGKSNGNQCELPGNKDPITGLQAFVNKSGTPCTIAKARPLGHSSSVTLFEVTCADSPGGFLLQTSSPPRLDKPIIMNPCIGFAADSAVKCELTDRATQGQVVDQLVAKSGKACQVKDRGYIGASQKGVLYFEVACQDGKGFVLEQQPAGGGVRAIDCAAADFIGGCKLTDARQAKTDQDALYTTLAKKAGFDCQVSGYAPLPNSAENRGKEVVELACSNRPDGAIAFFGATSADPSVVYNCAISELKGYRCSLTKPAAAYPALTKALNTLGKQTCQVSASRTMGISGQDGFVEVACADGGQGYVIKFGLNPPTPQQAIICAQASSMNGGCTLPGNKKS